MWDSAPRRIYKHPPLTLSSGCVSDFTESFLEIKKGVPELPPPPVFTKTLAALVKPPASRWPPFFPSTLAGPLAGLKSRPLPHHRFFFPLNCPQVSKLFSLSPRAAPLCPAATFPPYTQQQACGYRAYFPWKDVMVLKLNRFFSLQSKQTQNISSV